MCGAVAGVLVRRLLAPPVVAVRSVADLLRSGVRRSGLPRDPLYALVARLGHLTHVRTLIRIEGTKLEAPLGEPLRSMLDEVWVRRCYASSEAVFETGQTIVDIGANVGVFTVWAATRTPGLRVIALEPSSRACAFLRRNVEHNGLRNVTIVQAACGGEQREAVLYARGPGVMNTLYRQDLLGRRFRAAEHVPVLTLDGVFERFAVRSCALLKLDCEGAEYEVLLNATTDTLRKVDRISLEYHLGMNEHTPDELVDRLQALGFRTELTSPTAADPECGYLLATRR